MRNYKRKTNQGTTGLNVMLAAARQVKLCGKSVRKAAKDMSIPEATLRRFCKKVTHEDFQDSIDKLQHKIGYKKSRQTFNEAQEQLLEDYLIKASESHCGLLPKEVRAFAYEYAVAVNIKFPKTWHDNKMAGEDWFTAFMKRHNKISIQTSEASNLARRSGFQGQNVGTFFENIFSNSVKCEPADECNSNESEASDDHNP